MRKFYFSFLLAVAVFVSLSFESFNVTAIAAEKETQVLTPAQIEEINVVLEILRNHVNTRLEHGETNITLFGSLSFQKEPISLSFQVEELGSSISPFSVQQRKTFRTEVKNTAGFDFGHVLTGSFLWGSGKVGNYSYDAFLYGSFYGKTHSTRATRLDPSVVEISSMGTFKALKYAPVEYNTHMKVELYGSGTYRLMESKLAIK
ncbi:hypothetical protein [Lysinibacillus varians]|uniref:Uncharacterized protein n=1 Tax=Lysinibacillus varians TaxID=1145276 RepID=A0ABY2T6K4_9BACI|nr:hypothetical protein [Lysinibacillus varians]AHN23938.1 hypothetical protein T479_02555 [Lysinibacillus varians]TKI59668.1 hypothetical protein FC752_17690 [Lysinibacillus varians]